LKDIFDALRASLLSPQDLVWTIREINSGSLWALDSLLVLLLAGLAILSGALYAGFNFFLLFYLPLAFLLWFICGGIAHVWCVNSKGTATWKETTISTPLALFFPMILTILLFTLSRFFVVPLLQAGNPSGGVKALDFIFSFLGPIYGWFFYYKVLTILHFIKPRNGMGSSLVAIFIAAVVAYFLGILIP